MVVGVVVVTVVVIVIVVAADQLVQSQTAVVRDTQSEVRLNAGAGSRQIRQGENRWRQLTRWST